MEAGRQRKAGHPARKQRISRHVVAAAAREIANESPSRLLESSIELSADPPRHDDDHRHDDPGDDFLETLPAAPPLAAALKVRRHEVSS
jgi:hypothetical protein